MLVAVLMAVPALLIPGTAHADAADVSVSVEFDNLSADRIATVTLEARSESGITNVEAAVENRRLPDVVEPIGTLPFTLVGGTANDGTWQGEYEVDIEAHPGFIVFDVAVTTADGVTLNREAGLRSCYAGQFADLTTTPVIVDPDEQGIKVRGRLLLRKTGESEPEPAPQGLIVRGTGESSTQTSADGSFVIALPLASTSVYVPGGQVVCNVLDAAPRVDSYRWNTEISASIVTPQPVEVGAEVTVKGVVRRQGRDGLEPLENMTVAGFTGYSTDGQVRVGSVDSSEDGTFQFTFTAQGSGPLTVQTEDDSFLNGSRVAAGVLRVAGTPEFREFNAVSQHGPAGARGDTIIATGRLVNGDTPIVGEQVHLESSRNGHTLWTRGATAATAGDGSFSLRLTALDDGYYRVRSAGGDAHAPTVSVAEYAEVRALTFVDGFSAEPGEDGLVALRGKLRRSDAHSGPVSSRPVHFYFLPEGESTWEYRGSATTDGDGAFAGEFTDHRDGGWTVWFWGDDEHSGANAPVVNVDIRVDYWTRFPKFDVLPKSVEPGQPITVSGALNRHRGSDPQEAAEDKPVAVYFLPTGSSTWTQVAVTRTGADGSFEKSLTAKRDGYWTAWFWGDEDHAWSNSATRYVDVR